MTRIEEIIEDLKKQGLDSKYSCPGLYCIKIEDKIVYVGKSLNMLQRIASHLVNIEQPGSANKYKVLAQAHRLGYAIGFDVIYKS